MIGTGVTYAVSRAEDARAQAQFDATLAEAASLVAGRVGQDIAFLTATRAFVQARQQDIPRKAFAAYVRGLGLQGPYDGLQGVGIAQIIPPGGEAEALRRLHAEHGPGHRLWPESTGSLRTAITLLEPADERNRAAIGYDMFTEERRRAAMTRALEIGAPVASAPVTLVQEITRDQQPGILVFLALESREDGLPEGFVYSPIRTGDLFRAALVNSGLGVELRAHDLAHPDEPLFQSAGFDPAAGPSRLMSGLTLPIAGREWRFLGHEKATPGLMARKPFTVMTAAGVLLLAIATALAVQGMGAAIRKARALNAAQAQLMREKDLHLREMSHRLKNALTRVAAMARQAARGTASKEEFVASMTARLRAMADAQDLLTRSATETTDLRALLMAEMAQLQGDGESQPEVEGPAVSLDTRQTQSLGLAFHELATNALKYGAGAIPGASLHVSWQVVPDVGQRFLVLTWDERTGRPATEPTRKGFGSQLLDSCIKVELGGTIQRRYHERGFTADIRLPLDPA